MESKRLHGEGKQRNECMLCLFAMLFLKIFNNLGFLTYGENIWS